MDNALGAGTLKNQKKASVRPRKTKSPTTRPAADGNKHSVGKPVGAVISGVAVIIALHKAQRPLKASEVARAANLHRGTAFNILRTLQREGIVTYNETERTYGIGVVILELAHGVLRASGLLDVARPEMFSLAERARVTVALGKVTKDYDLVLLDFVGGGFRVDSYFSVGRRSRRFSGAAGLVMAAFSGASDRLIEEEYEHTEWFRRPPFKEYTESIALARSRGFALDRGNRRSGLTQVAVPIFSQTGSLALVLTAADFSYSMTEQRIDEVARAMLAFSDRISSELSRLRLE